MSNNKQLINHCLSNKDLDNIVEMLENYYTLLNTAHKRNFPELKGKDDQYIKNTLDHNWNYSNIVNYLNDVAIPFIDDFLDEPNDKTVLPISYETH